MCSSTVITGVPQGSVLGLVLFLIYINDVVDISGDGFTAKLFADDVKIYIVLDDINTPTVLQHSLDALAHWADLWQLTISIKKMFCSASRIN